MPSFKSPRSIAVVLAACAFFIGPSSAGAGLPPGFFGLVSEDVFAGDANYRAATLLQQDSVGVGLIRQTFHWRDIEVARGVYNWSVYDSYMAATASHAIRVLPILFEPPRFRARIRAHGTDPPRNYADIGAFGAAVARRYGPNGTFWKQNPGIFKLPITAYQIWNEPNLRVYWPTGQNAKQYAKLLKAARRGIRAADPQAEIVTAGLPDSRLSKPKDVYQYVEAMLKAGAGRSFNTLAVNPYARNKTELLKKLRKFRGILNAHHDRRAKIWITELGWSDVGPPSPFRAGVAGQVRNITASIPALVKARSKLKLRGIVYYSWRDAAPYPPLFKDFWGLHTGLLHRDGSAKPALAAFQSAIANSR
jgi:hypothetical protein